MSKATWPPSTSQDQLRPAGWLEIVAGLRFDSFHLDVDDLGGRRRQVRPPGRNWWSPRLGLVLKPTANLSLYASYSRSYLPQSGDQFSGLPTSPPGSKPERFDNFEVGAKWELLDGLLATAAIYRLDRTNTRAADPADPSRTVLTGAQRSRGIELGLERQRHQPLADLRRLRAAESGNHRSNTAAAPAGRKVPLVPRHSVSLWNR